MTGPVRPAADSGSGGGAGRGPLLRLAGWLIRRACRPLPEETRDDRYREWTAELPHIMDDQAVRFAGRRAVRALLFAADQSRGTRPAGRARSPLRARAALARPGASGAGERLRPIVLGGIVGYFGGGGSGLIGGVVLGVLCVTGGWAFDRLGGSAAGLLATAARGLRRRSSPVPRRGRRIDKTAPIRPGPHLSLGIVAGMGLAEDDAGTTAGPGNAARSRVPAPLRPTLDRARRHPRLIWAAFLVTAALGLYVAYLRQARTYPLTADPAAQALQAWQMWHGNPLLRGWWLGDVNFYTVELPLNIIVERVSGLRAGDVEIGAALVYTAVVLLTALLARGSARGREGVVRALLGAGIMLAPSLAYGTRVLMQGPDHMGTMIPILAMLLILDRAPERWWVPVAVGLMLTWAQVSDPLATYAAAAAVAVACGVRACSDMRRRQRPPKSRRFDVLLVVAALVSIGLAHLILARINAVGGFYFPPPKNGVGLAPLAALPLHARLTGYSVLILFGADFVGQPLGIGTILAVLHLAGVALGLWALGTGLRGFFSRMDRVAQALVAGTVIIAAAGALGTYMTAPVVGAHEVIPLLPFGAALAGRLLGGRLVQARLEPVLALGLACYLGALAYNDTAPVQAPAHQELAGWLSAHHLRYGLAGYWEANVTTLDSGGQVRVAPLADGGASAEPYESDSAWYNPAVSTANFIVSVSSPPRDVSLVKASVLRARYGRPVRTYHFKEYTVRVYGYNLLTRLTVPALGGF